MSPKFPLLVARVEIASRWSLHLPVVFQQRLEEGSMVLWRPGITFWITVWNNDHRESAARRKASFQSEASPEKFDEREWSKGKRLYYSYRLIEESEDERQAALYGFVFSEHGHLQMACYFDDEEDAELAYDILKSVNSDSPSLDDCRVFSQMCFVTNEVIKEGRPVGYMYRETPESAEDSGWRFFAGDEPEEYMADPDNTQFLPVALVAQCSLDIVPYLNVEPETQLERRGSKFV